VVDKYTQNIDSY